MKQVLIFTVIVYMVAQQIIINRYVQINDVLLNQIDELLEVCE